MIRVHGLEVPTDVAEILAPERVAVLVIDMQNDYCATSSVDQPTGPRPQYAEIIPRIKRVLVACRVHGIPIFHIRMVSVPGQTDSPSWLRLRMRARTLSAAGQPLCPDVVVDGTWGGDFVEGLHPQPGDTVVSKTRSSAFFGTSLDSLVRATGRQTLVFTGCTTEGCVESSARDAGFRDYFPVVLTDCVASASAELHDASLQVMGAYRADLLSSPELLAAWGPRE
jgi:nicotinamidase-related amidase